MREENWFVAALRVPEHSNPVLVECELKGEKWLRVAYYHALPTLGCKPGWYETRSATGVRTKAEVKPVVRWQELGMQSREPAAGDPLKEAVMSMCDGTFNDDPADWNFTGTVPELLKKLRPLMK